MSLTSRKNLSVKALQTHLNHEKKLQWANGDKKTITEWEIACNTSYERGQNPTHENFKANFDRDYGDAYGASKTVHLHNQLIEGSPEFKYICVKRHRTEGYIDEHAFDNSPMTGNQLIDEILTWETFEEKPESDYFCPILKYFTSKSDKVNPISEKAQENVVIIAQKALPDTIGNCKYACEQAQKLNEANNILSISAYERYDELEVFAEKMRWRDVMHNRGNCGVIYDYSRNCYKAVFIDYGL